MFMHVVETNQHNLHNIYVHGGLYPTWRGFVTADVLEKGLSRGAIATG